MWSCPVQQWEGESVNLWKINIVLYLQYVVSNLYIPANRLRIIQKVPTPTSFDLSTTADMLLRSSYIKKGYSENKILDYCLHCSFHIAQINNPLISSWSSEHVTFHCWNGANHSVNLAKHISSMCLCSGFSISEQLLISKMNLLLMILPLYSRIVNNHFYPWWLLHALQLVRG